MLGWGGVVRAEYLHHTCFADAHLIYGCGVIALLMLPLFMLPLLQPCGCVKATREPKKEPARNGSHMGCVGRSWEHKVHAIVRTQWTCTCARSCLCLTNRPVQMSCFCLSGQMTVFLDAHKIARRIAEKGVGLTTGESCG